MTPIQAGVQIGKTLKNAGRLRVIVGVFAKHGFQNLAERVKLGQFIIDRLKSEVDIEKYSVPERIRMSFEELGPTFIKLGQLLATRPDLIPSDFVEEFEKFHDQVQPLSFEVIEDVLKEEFGNALYTKFPFIDPIPLGSASIAQVHRARIASGENVVIKVQKPGIVAKINDDLNVLYFLADLLETYVPETRPFNPKGIVNEYFKTLELETNFIVESNNIRRFKENFKNEAHVHIPEVYTELVTERVLTMEALQGLPLSNNAAMQTPGTNSEQIIRLGIRTYLKMIFTDGLFHGDLHAGNFFILENNNIGLIDFGVIGRLNSKTQSAVANMLLALAKEDYERLAYEYVDLAPFTDQVKVEQFAKELRELIAPYYGLTLKDVNLGKLLMSSSAVAAKHHITLPTELMMFFKSIVCIEGIGRKIKKDFDFLSYSIEMAEEIVRNQYDASKVASEFSTMARESKNFINALPRQLHFLLRKLNSPEHSLNIRLNDVQDLKKSIESSFNLLFLGIIIAALILSSAVIFNQPSANMVYGIPVASFVGYILACALGFIAFINYIKKN